MTQRALTFSLKSDRIRRVYGKEEEEYPRFLLQREPLVGEKGRAEHGEYTLELTSERFFNSVGVFRERPLPRSACDDTP